MDPIGSHTSYLLEPQPPQKIPKKIPLAQDDERFALDAF